MECPDFVSDGGGLGLCSVGIHPPPIKTSSAASRNPSEAVTAIDVDKPVRGVRNGRVGTIVSVDPRRCRMWKLHDRIEHHVNEDTCRSEIESFLKHGQLVPTLGRTLGADPDHDIELIYGARRLFIARHIGKPLLVELLEISDKEAIVAMDIENRQRTDISPYERGLGYARWLRSGYFHSQEDMARALRVSCSQVSRLLKLSRLPSVVTNAFATPLDIRESWGLALLEALDDPERRELTLRRARALSYAKVRPSSGEVYRDLLRASVRGAKVKSRPHDEVVKDASGAPLFRIRQQRDSIALVLPAEKVTEAVLEKIRHRLTRLLGRSSQQTTIGNDHVGVTAREDLRVS